MEKATKTALVFCCFIFPGYSFGAIYNFDITYDGLVQTVDAGSDPLLGTVLVPGDSFVLDFHTAGNDYWEVVNADWGIYASFLVAPAGFRVGDSRATFLMDGTVVAQDIDLGVTQSSIHVGAQNTTLRTGVTFDQLVVDYSLFSDTSGSTAIQTDDVFWNFMDRGGDGVYRKGVAPEPTSVIIWPLLGLVVGALRWRRRKAA